MTTIDAGMERTRPVIGWLSTHGAATAFIGCAAFWTAVAASLYFIL